MFTVKINLFNQLAISIHLRKNPHWDFFMVYNIYKQKFKMSAGHVLHVLSYGDEGCVW